MFPARPIFSNDASGNVTGLVDNNGNLIPFPTTAGTPRYSRAPTYLDNASRGYGASSVWQANGQIYQPVAAPDATAAAWAPAPYAMAAPVDAFTAALTKFAGGMTVMKSGYTGAAIDVQVTVGGVLQTPVTINFLANGQLDVVSLQAQILRADANTLVYVTKLYDQSGAGNHAVSISTYTGSISGTTLTVTAVSAGSVGVGQVLSGTGVTGGTTITAFISGTAGGAGTYTVSASQTVASTTITGTDNPLVLDYDAFLKQYVICNSMDGSTLRGLRFPIAMTGLNANSCGMFAIGRAAGSADTNNDVVLTLGDWPTSGAQMNQMNTNAAGGLHLNLNPTAWDPATSTISMDSAKCVLGTISTGTQAWYMVNDTLNQYTSTPPNQAYESGFIGRAHSLSLLCGFRFSGVVITTGAVTQSQISMFRNWCYAWLDIKPQTRNQLFLIGDSRMSSIITPTNGKQYSMGIAIASYLRNQPKIFGMATSGYTSAQALSNNVPQLVAMANQAGMNNVCAALIGVNDFIVSGLTVAQSLANIKSLMAGIKAANNIKVILIAELNTTNTTNNANTQVPLLRAAINSAGASGMGVDLLLDISALTPVATPSNTNYYYDGLHPQLALTDLIASTVAPYIDQWMDS